ncbi:K+-sensing histidine kinase KdpD [Catenulispora sp. EB89]|uniref:universal stress protein n=1 Tax=Catenulispora sp. EB89 TaxID=3156257 RepID=UPI003515848A
MTIQTHPRPTAADATDAAHAQHSRGRLRIYLGAAPGVGKTYAMLAEGQRRRARGADVVIGLVEPHGRRLAAAMAEGLETVPRRTAVHAGATFTELDVEAVLARAPQVALVDELAHSNVPGSRNAKRRQDVEELLAAGIDVVATVNIQHLESLADVVEQITGVVQYERLPDAVARAAEQVELVDMAPEALRRRMVHGDVYPPDRVEAELTHFFRPGNLTALRELALLWVSDRVEEGLERYRADHAIAKPWETRERIAVALAGGPEGVALIRRAARIVTRTPGAELLAVHVVVDDGPASRESADLAEQRQLVEAAGGMWHEVVGEDVAARLAAFTRAYQVTQLVVGGSGAGRLSRVIAGPGVGSQVLRLADHVDVHLVARDQASGQPPRQRTPNGRRATRAEADAVKELALTAVRGGGVTELLEVVRDLLALDAISLLEPGRSIWAGEGLESSADNTPAWYVMAGAGDNPPEQPTAFTVSLGSEGLLLAAQCANLNPAGLRVLTSCSDLIAAALNGILRPGPLAEQPGSPIGLESEVYLRPVDLDEVVAAVLGDLEPGHGLGVTLVGDVPDAVADAALLTRALTGLAALALRRSPKDQAARISIHALDETVEITICDDGERMSQPDAEPSVRLARSLLDSMHCTLRVLCDDAGLTATAILPAAARTALKVGSGISR